jgi:hypothetical protein
VGDELRHLLESTVSLLDNGESYESATVYPEEVYESRDGNPMTRASQTGIPVLARFQVQGQSGTASRRAEQQGEGFSSERVYEMRLARKYDALLGELGAQSQVDWRGQRWSLFGDPGRYNGSRRTRRNIYRIMRS